MGDVARFKPPKFLEPLPLMAVPSPHISDFKHFGGGLCVLRGLSVQAAL